MPVDIGPDGSPIVIPDSPTTPPATPIGYTEPQFVEQVATLHDTSVMYKAELLEKTNKIVEEYGGISNVPANSVYWEWLNTLRGMP